MAELLAPVGCKGPPSRWWHRGPVRVGCDSGSTGKGWPLIWNHQDTITISHHVGCATDGPFWSPSPVSADGLLTIAKDRGPLERCCGLGDPSGIHHKRKGSQRRAQMPPQFRRLFRIGCHQPQSKRTGTSSAPLL